LLRAGAEAWLELHIKNSSGGATKIVQRTLLVEYLRSAKPIPRIDCHKCQASVALLPASAGVNRWRRSSLARRFIPPIDRSIVFHPRLDKLYLEQHRERHHDP
jgi:hypothetical protein